MSHTPMQLVDGIDYTNEDGLAMAFSHQFAEEWRYCAPWSKWLVWNGVRWNIDKALYVMHLCRLICRAASVHADGTKLKGRLASSGTISAIERIVRSEPRHSASVDEWDSSVWLLNTPGGIVDLRTGARGPHDRERRMTKVTTASPQGDCPVWRNFLVNVTGGDDELQDYLQRVVGYCLTGDISTHALFFLYGTGANGKSVFVNVISTVLGDYAANAPMDTFMESRSDRHPTDLAGLRGARFVSATETEQGRRWNESKIKAITGGDDITARLMHQDFFTYRPQFKLLIAGNHKPAIRNIDEAMRRRMHLIPFTITVPPEKRDPLLTEKLLAERDGIMAWAVQGCLLWQSQGLSQPKSVVSATEEYFEAEDAMGRWMTERCNLGVNHKALTATLFNDWKQWAELSGEYIPALVVDVSDEDAFIMSLAENIARRGYRPLEILADIELLRERGYTADVIIQKTGLSPKYVRDIVFLLEQGEERLIEGVQRGSIPLTTALEIARASANGPQNANGEGGESNLGDLLQEAYENGQLKGRQIIEAKRLIEKRQELGPSSPNAAQIKPPTSSYSLVRTYQKEVERQRKMVLKAEHAHQRLLLVVQGLKKLFADENFVTLLRAEGLDTLPKYLAERINHFEGAPA